MHVLFTIIIFFGVGICSGLAQQLGDTLFHHPINKPAYTNGNGPVVYIDGGHNNFHQAEHRFRPFAQLLRADGYRIGHGDRSFQEEWLKDIDILVIANALHETNEEDWILPTPSAFTDEEIAVLESWVRSGGRLLLIADHMPFPGAAASLAAAFGFEFNNGFAFARGKPRPPAHFTRSDQTLKEHSIVADNLWSQALDSIATFTGQGFRTPQEAQTLLEFAESSYSLMPDTAWQFNDATPRVDLQGWSQGAVLKYGEGRIAVFGEAAMFTAQIAGPQAVRVGFNSPLAPHNAQFVLNVIHWLDGLLE